MNKIKPKLTLYLSGFLIVILLGAGLFFIPVVAHFANISTQNELTNGCTRSKFICEWYKSISLPEGMAVAEKAPEVLGQAITASSYASTSSPSPSAKIFTKTLAFASLKPSAAPSLKPSASPAPSANLPSATANPSSLSPAAGSATAPNSSTSVSPSPSASASTTPAPSPSPSVSTVNLEIQGSSFTVEISGDLNVCQVLEKAREQGKVSSLTLDDSYMSSMHSLYVKEMNGLSNNWTFKVNGNSPLGCSLYQVKPGDQIVWKFG